MESSRLYMGTGLNFLRIGDKNHLRQNIFFTNYINITGRIRRYLSFKHIAFQYVTKYVYEQYIYFT